MSTLLESSLILDKRIKAAKELITEILLVYLFPVILVLLNTGKMLLMQAIELVKAIFKQTVFLLKPRSSMHQRLQL